MFFRQLLHDERSCASYVIGCTTRGVAAVVDPQGDSVDYAKLVERHGMHITDVFDTHVHADHLSIARELADRSGATLRIGAGDEVDFDHLPVADNEVVSIGNRRIRALHTPGHTPEHVCLLVDDWFVVTGDTLFVGDVGRVDLALAGLDEDELQRRAELLHASLQRLLHLPDHTEIYPGHYAGSVCGRGMDGKPSSTIGRERDTNPALTLDLHGFVEFQQKNVPPLPAEFDRIKRANVGSSNAATEPDATLRGR